MNIDIDTRLQFDRVEWIGLEPKCDKPSSLARVWASTDLHEGVIRELNAWKRFPANPRIMLAWH